MEAQVTKNSSFFYACKENYFLGILPADPKSKDKAGYQALVNIAKVYFSLGLYEPIVQYLNEGRYYMKIWSAYLILEYGNPGEDLKASCLETIKGTITQFQKELSAQQIDFFTAYLKEKY
ncbi:MAG TPA: hypothetical protein VGB63_10715 [Pedobacter sp.]|jgi:hypothetical protein